jgi:hypothetical protein
LENQNKQNNMTALSLDNYGVVEMDAATAREIDGGFWWLLVLGAAAVMSSCQSGNGNQMDIGGTNNRQSSHVDSASSGTHVHAHGHLHVQPK